MRPFLSNTGKAVFSVFVISAAVTGLLVSTSVNNYPK